MRLHLVDGIRGHLLIGMLIAHLSFGPGMGALGYAHHHFLIRMYDAEFFVPISGFIIGFLFTDRIKTAAGFYRFLNGRLLTIYKYYLLSAVPFLLFALLANPSWGFLPLVGSVAIMQDGGSYSDILPIYFYCFLLLYALFWMVPRVGFMPPLAVSGIIYLVSQATYSAGWFGLGDRFIIFDIAAWQFLFMIFLAIGAHSREALAFIENLPRKSYFAMIAALVVLLVIGRQTSFYPTPFAGYEALNPNWPRMQLHPLFMAKILVVIALFCTILVRPDGLLAWPNKVMRWYFSLPFLRNVGNFSIQMFTLHVFMMAIFKKVAPIMAVTDRYALAVVLIAIFVAAPNLWVMTKRRRVAVPAVA